MFQVYTSVRVTNEELEHHGQAGTVVGLPKKEGDPVIVRIDADNTEYEFAASDLASL